MRGTKKTEYRSRPTHVTGEVYVYASLTPGDIAEFKKLKLQPGDLQTGYIIGTIEIIGCIESKSKKGLFEWLLRNPKRLKQKLKPNPEQHPQPVWFYPFGK